MSTVASRARIDIMRSSASAHIAGGAHASPAGPRITPAEVPYSGRSRSKFSACSKTTRRASPSISRTIALRLWVLASSPRYSAIRARYLTFHSCTPAENPGCMATSIRSAVVVTGAKASVFHAFGAVP